MCQKSDSHDKVKNAMDKLQQAIDQEGLQTKQKQRFAILAILKWVVILTILTIVLISLFLFTTKVISSFVSRQPKINSTGIKLIYVPSGEFMVDSFPAGKEQHRVIISKGFWIGQTEVTQAQWNSVRGNNPSHFRGDNLPVESVSWYDAVKFCSELSQREGRKYRLPTESEWIYACRERKRKWFTTKNIYSHIAKIERYAWFDENSNRKTHPVKQKKPNSLEIYDMYGNVDEWCSDWYKFDFYSVANGTDPAGAISGDQRASRGGGWDTYNQGCSMVGREGNRPDHKGKALGFRVVLEAE